MHTSTRFPWLYLALLLPVSVHCTEYVVPVNDVAGFFARLPSDATQASFSAAAEYRCEGDIVLPDRQLLIIDGKGAKLFLGARSSGFTTPIVDQKHAERHTASRYIIRDFASINGGRKGIDLQATLGSEISNVRLVGQSETAIDLRFCLMARMQNVLVTHPADRGIVLRQGDWPGANGINSQCNSCVLDQCRVFSSRTTTAAFTVLNSGGVSMVNCISEGESSDYDLFLSATLTGNEDTKARNPVVKSFTLSNFHVEHKTRKASIYLNMPSRASIQLNNVFWNAAQVAPVIVYVDGQLDLSAIGWWVDGFRIASRVSAPRINIQRCNNKLAIHEGLRKGPEKVGALELLDPFSGHSKLTLRYVRVSDPSM